MVDFCPVFKCWSENLTEMSLCFTIIQCKYGHNPTVSGFRFSYDSHCKIFSRIVVDSTVNILQDPMCRFICVLNVCDKVNGCQTHDAFVTGMTSQKIYKIDLRMRKCIDFCLVIISVFVFTSRDI